MMDIWNKSVRSVLGGALCGYGFVSFFCFLYLVETWHAEAPHSANVWSGAIYPHNEHGDYRFFTAFQATTCFLMFPTSIPTFLLGILISPKKNIRGTARWYGFNYHWDQDDPNGLGKRAAISTAIATPFLVFFAGPYVVRGLNAVGFVMNLG